MGPHRMSTGWPGGEAGEEHFIQRERHEENYGGGKSMRHLKKSVAGESGPGLERGLRKGFIVRWGV